MKGDIKKKWGKRSKKFGRRIEGVLPKSLPGVVNEYLHNWMLGQVESVVDRNKNFRIVDLGCGYGRLSFELLKKFPKLRTFGVDIAPKYVDLYNKSLAPKGYAVVGDIGKLPFRNSFFDAAFIVTSLMYLTKKEEQHKAVAELFRVLKPGGNFVIIERNPIGQALVTAGGLVSKIRGKKFQEIESVSFKKEDIESLINKNGGKIISHSALPIWTLFLPFLISFSFLSNAFLGKLLDILLFFDQKLSFLLTPSMYISYIGTKKNDSS